MTKARWLELPMSRTNFDCPKDVRASVKFDCVYVNHCNLELINLQKPEIYSLHVVSDIKYRFSTTQVTSRVKNSDETPREAIFDVTLPNEAFITNLTL